ncbi:MAG: ABC transporter substrate-binding protein [Spirochaetaceae bacterium]|jgi:ABC-type nitrate/sulfonate/bicarbonate transport system substrate-binding protein|nr:ABC transporter substrate-binding protein [Spirochaetaceae bacterium]
MKTKIMRGEASPLPTAAVVRKRALGVFRHPPLRGTPPQRPRTPAPGAGGHISTIHRVLLTVLCALLIAACQPKRETGQIRVVLDWTPNTNHTGLYAALENGYFDEAGLEVTIEQPPEDGALLLLAAGGAEFAVDFQESLAPALARAEPLPVSAVAAIIAHNTSGIMSLDGAGIRRPRDLEGKRFASWETPLVNAIIKNIVEGDGGDFSRVKMVPNAATDAFSALATDVDAIWIYHAWDGIAADIREIPVNYLDLAEINPVFDFYTPILLVNNDYAASNPEEASKFMAALSRGYQFAMENPAEAAEILLKHAPELGRTLVTRSQEYLATRYQADSPRWGEIDGERWDRFYGWMFDEHLLEKDIRGQGFTNRFLP